MANRVLGIEIGENLTRVVEIDYKAKNPKIYNMFGFPTPPGMMEWYSRMGCFVLSYTVS